MTLNDPLANAMSKIMNAEKVGKSECVIKPSSKFIKTVLTLLQDEGYLGGFDEMKDSMGDWLVVHLLGKVNKCGAVKPRFAISVDMFERFEKRYLPAKNFGIILVSTSQGLMTHNKAKESKIGGKLIAYCY
ncbi:MAG: 30S ribosomal protein S8 [Candidatus Nanoarchaeia archaeon]